jgi:hypothetical protein
MFSPVLVCFTKKNLATLLRLTPKQMPVLVDFQVPPFFGQAGPVKANSLRGQNDWDQGDEKKQRQQLMMGGERAPSFFLEGTAA